MKSQRLRLSRIFFAVIVLFFALFSACKPISRNTQKAWIDVPFKNSSYQAGELIHLQAHVYAGSGVAEVQCSIDSIPYHRGVPETPGSTFSIYAYDLIINDPGEHIISVVAFDAEGNPSNPAFVDVTITQAEQSASVTAAPADTPVSPAASPTTQETSAPEAVVINFWADQTQLQQGHCTNLNWNVQNADSISLDNSDVGASGSQQVCPSQTTSYTLIANALSGQKQQSLTISVSSPPPQADQDPPVITNISHSPVKIWNYYTCGADTFTVSASVSDASSINSVSIRFRVVKGAESGSWVERSLSGSGGNYQISITPNDLKQSMAKYRGMVEYTISAQDTQGNTSHSGTKTIEVGECLL
jgi:hypothetical protein